jgi:hypothetical protein
VREILIGEKQIKDKPFSYYLLAEDVADTCESYGVKISGGPGDLEAIPALTCSQRDCQKLVEQLMEFDVTATTLRDVVDDWLLRD